MELQLIDVYSAKRSWLRAVRGSDTTPCESFDHCHWTILQYKSV